MRYSNRHNIRHTWIAYKQVCCCGQSKIVNNGSMQSTLSCTALIQTEKNNYLAITSDLFSSIVQAVKLESRACFQLSSLKIEHDQRQLHIHSSVFSLTSNIFPSTRIVLVISLSRLTRSSISSGNSPVLNRRNMEVLPTL